MVDDAQQLLRPRSRLFADSPASTPGLRFKVCAQITHARRWQVSARLPRLPPPPRPPRAGRAPASPRLPSHRRRCLLPLHPRQVLYSKVLPRYLLVFDSFITGVLFRRLPAMQPDAAASPTYAEDRRRFALMMAAAYAVLAPRLAGFTPRTLLDIVTGAPRRAAPLRRRRGGACSPGACGLLHGGGPGCLGGPERLLAPGAGMHLVGVPDAGFLSLWQQHSQAALPQWKPAQLPQALGALAGLGFAPQQQWMQGLYAAAAACWQELTSAELAQLAAALGTLQQQPPEPWMEQLCAAAQRRLEEELAGRVATARPPARLAKPKRVRQPPGPAVLLQAPGIAPAAPAAQPPRPASSSSSGGGGGTSTAEVPDPAAELLQPLTLQRHAAARLSELLRALGALGYLPDDAWLAWACQLLQGLVASGACSPEGLISLLEAWAELGLSSHPELLDALYSELQWALLELQPAQLCQLGRVLLLQRQQEQQEPPAAWLEAWQQALAAAMPAMSTEQLCACVEAAYGLQLRPSGSWVGALCLVSQARLHAFDQQQLVGLVRALGLLRVQVSPLWAGAVLGHVAAAVSGDQGGWDEELLLALVQSVEQLQTDVEYVRARYSAQLQQLRQAAGSV
jgi:hypothetical protein